MALFPHHVEDSINAAISMQKEIILYNGYRVNQGYPSEWEKGMDVFEEK
jgi:hypothetical protein